jgi:hypothetical protein
VSRRLTLRWRELHSCIPILGGQKGVMVNSNKGTKRDMAISLIPFDRLDFRTLGYPKNGSPFSPPILGSNSDAVSQLLVREVILAEQVEVLPGNRRAMATASRNASRLAVGIQNRTAYLILQGLPQACRAFYERSHSRWRTDGGGRSSEGEPERMSGRADSIGTDLSG